MPLKKQYKKSLRELSEILSEEAEEFEQLKKSKDFLDFDKLVREKGYCPPGAYSHSLKKLRRGWMSPVRLYKTLKNAEIQGYNRETFYSLNSHGLRSDEFRKKHSGTHIVFAGCSITFGEGLPIEKTWSRILHDRISSFEKTSGYFNIAAPGLTPIESIYQIENYMAEFGKPDVIFLNLPDFEREGLTQSMDKALPESEMAEMTLKLIHGTYDMFRRSCLNNGIKLFSFTWDHPEATYWDYPFDIVPGLEDFYLYSINDRSRHIYQYGIDNPEEQKSDLYDKALDGEHPGSAVNDFYSKFMYGHYASWRNNDK